MFIPWVALGFDSGIGMLEIWNNNWQIDYSIYGKSLHFSAFIIYGFLFYGLSKHLEKLNINGSKNILYSSFLVLGNISLFEHVYMATVTHYQHNLSLWQWYIQDFFFLQQYLWLLVLGATTLFALYIDSYIIQNHKTVGRYFKFKPNKKIFVIIGLCVVSFLVWIYFPFPVETITIGDWTSSRLFPQTHYYRLYENHAFNIYVPNDLLHLVNLVAKALFAFAQLYIISCFKKVDEVG